MLFCILGGLSYPVAQPITQSASPALLFRYLRFIGWTYLNTWHLTFNYYIIIPLNILALWFERQADDVCDLLTRIWHTIMKTLNIGSDFCEDIATILYWFWDSSVHGTFLHYWRSGLILRLAGVFWRFHIHAVTVCAPFCKCLSEDNIKWIFQYTGLDIISIAAFSHNKEISLKWIE